MNVGGAADVQVLDLIMDESWKWACSISSGTTEFTEDADENGIVSTKLLRARTKALGTTLWHMQAFPCGWKGFGEEMIFQSQRFSRYTHIKVPAQGHVPKHREESSMHLWGVPISMAGMWV